MKSKAIIINPRFSEVEVARIDQLVESGEAKSRADFVRNLVRKHFWEVENLNRK